MKLLFAVLTAVASLLIAADPADAYTLCPTGYSLVYSSDGSGTHTTEMVDPLTQLSVNGGSNRLFVTTSHTDLLVFVSTEDTGFTQYNVSFGSLEVRATNGDKFNALILCRST